MLSYEDVEEAELTEAFGDIVDNKTRRKINKQVFVRGAYFKTTGYEGTQIKYANSELKFLISKTYYKLKILL